MGLTGFGKKAIPIQFDVKSMFPPSSTAFLTPTFADLMKIKTTQDVADLTIVNQTNKKRVKSFCILPPFLTQRLHQVDNDPKQILVSFVQAIANKTITATINNEDMSDPQNQDTTPEDDTSAEEAIVTQDNANVDQEQMCIFSDPSREAEEHFYRILLFLWSIVHKLDKLQALAVIPATNKESTEWSDNVHFINLKQSPQTSSNNLYSALADGLDRAHTAPGNEHTMTRVASVLTKVAGTMNRDMEIKLSEKREAKQKTIYKNFHAFSQLTQTTICTASSYFTTPDNDKFELDGEEQQVTTPTKPSKFLLETFACTTGAAAKEHIHHHLGSNMIDVDIGMCTALRNGVFISQPTASDINTFSINFVPPRSDELDIEYNRNENARIMETSKNGKLTYADMEKKLNTRINMPKTMANSDTSLKTG